MKPKLLVPKILSVPEIKMNVNKLYNTKLKKHWLCEIEYNSIYKIIKQHNYWYLVDMDLIELA